MKTALPTGFLDTERGAQANRILRSCVHCGLCNATCPTYQVEANELDGPRGRIYLIKSMLEEAEVTPVTRLHLDRCLTCRACETTCPSGVDYHSLLDIGREEIDRRQPRPWWQRCWRHLLLAFFSRRKLFSTMLRLGRMLRPLAPRALAHYLTPERGAGWSSPATGSSRRVILVQGCVQPGLSPSTNRAAAHVMAHLDIGAIEAAGEQCCGAMAWHMGETERARAQARANIDAWLPHLHNGVEAIVMTASGCSLFVRDYAQLLRNDPRYAEPARQVVSLLKDISELLLEQDLSSLQTGRPQSLAWHCPCTAQHGQNLDASTRQVFQRLGFEAPAIKDAHLCCGSAGTYSLLQPAMAGELRRRKLENLQAVGAGKIVTANIGCQIHLSAGAPAPVLHWIEFLAERLHTRHKLEMGDTRMLAE